MTIFCKLCENAGGIHKIDSLIISNEKAWEECLTKLNNHVIRQHPKAVAEMQMSTRKLIEYGGLFMVTDAFAKIPDDEEYLLKVKEQAQQVLMVCAGFDPASEEEEEEVIEEEDEDEDIELTEEENKGVLHLANLLKTDPEFAESLTGKGVMGLLKFVEVFDIPDADDEELDPADSGKVVDITSIGSVSE